MRKIYPLVLLFAITTLGLQAQNPVTPQGHHTVKAMEVSGQSPTLLKALACSDTLDDYITRAANQFTLQGANGGGYVFGVSNDGSGGAITTATAVHYDDLGPITVDEVFVWMGAKQIIGSPDLIRMEIYTTGVDSMPNTLVGFTNASLAFVDTATSGVNFTTMTKLARFQVGVGSNQLTGDFAVALNYDAIDDTIAIVSTASGSGMMEGRTKQFLGPNFGGGWIKSNQLWTGLDADVVFLPVTTCVLSAEHPAFENQYFTVKPAYPNPSTDEIHLEIGLHKATDLQVILWDVTGRVMYDSGKLSSQAGSQIFDINVRDIAAGSYYYTVRTSETQVNSKVQVMH